MSPSATVPLPVDPPVSGKLTDLEIKDAHLIFESVWQDLEADFGSENLRFPKEIILLGGAPGAGKGTNTAFIGRARGLTCSPIVISALLDSPEARTLKDAGNMVGDREVVGLLLRQLLRPEYRDGVILDGFPRNLAQAAALDALLVELGKPLDAVVQMDVDYAELTRRIAGRRTCADCKRVYNVLTQPPGEAEKDTCPTTGGPHRLFQRPDDKEETVSERLRVYDEQTKPLVSFYRDKGILRSIDAEGELDDVTQRLEMALESISAPSAFDEARAAQPVAKTPAKKAPARKAPAKKAPVKTAARKGAAKKAPAKKGGKNAAAKKTPAAGKKAVARKAAGKKASAKKSALKKGAAKKASGKTSASRKKTPARKPAGKRRGKR